MVGCDVAASYGARLVCAVAPVHRVAVLVWRVVRALWDQGQGQHAAVGHVAPLYVVLVADPLI